MLLVGGIRSEFWQSRGFRVFGCFRKAPLISGGFMTALGITTVLLRFPRSGDFVDAVEEMGIRIGRIFREIWNGRRSFAKIRGFFLTSLCSRRCNRGGVEDFQDREEVGFSEYRN